MATGRRPGTLLSKGTTSLSQTAASGSLPPAPAWRSLLRREPEVLLNAIGGGGAEPGLGPRQRSPSRFGATHIQPHLAVGDVAAGQDAVPHRREEPASYPTGHDRQPTRPF